ncbi:unnamed protein product [Amoebophrya sp. A120]|nr:unnamed protein product [Amoebophrya sp. A120]|eukprot:GSA120T00023970001.1
MTGRICHAGPDKEEKESDFNFSGGSVVDIRGALRVVCSTAPGHKSKQQRNQYQGLTMTRSFGDFFFKQPTKLVESTPEVKIQALTPNDQFVVIVSDGICDVLKNQEIVNLALEFYDNAEEACKKIVRTAFNKGSEDNLTALIIQFAWADEKTLKCWENLKKGGGVNVETAGVQDVEDDDFDMFA